MSDRDQLEETIRGLQLVSLDQIGELTDAVLSSDWLARVKAEAFDEGQERGYKDAWEHTTSDNPYRVKP